VVAIDSKDPTKIGAWATLGKGEAIWAAGGMASDGTDVFAVTGNNMDSPKASSRTNSDSEQVVRIQGLAELVRNDNNLFFPSSWVSMDRTDADFGASSPLYLTVPGATPENYVLAIAKDGHMYLLDSTNLGGMKPLVDFTVSNGGMSVLTVPTAYTTASGVHVAFSASGAVMCPAGSPSGANMMSVLIAKGAPPVPSVSWCAVRRGEATAPVATTTDGQNEAIVWYMSNGKLTGVDGETGAVLFDGGDGSCSGVKRWTSPIAVKGRIVVGGDTHLCSWSPH
jgi:hypothetical protein